MMTNIDDNRVALAITPILRLAFRPFFSLGPLFALVSIAWWAIVWLLPVDWTPYGGKIWWHSHEMVFGFAPTIVAGFLLTAVQNWTGVPGIRGVPLGLLVASWMIGRLAIAFGNLLPVPVVVLADLLFLPCAAAAMAYPIIKVRMWGNFIFVPILLMLALFNGVSHWGIHNENYQVSMQVIHAAIMLITFVVAIIGGRVMPMFTSVGTGRPRIAPLEWLELCSLASILLVIVVTVFGYDMIRHPVATAIFAVAAILNSWRFLRMGFWQCWRVPLLWSLHLAFAFIPVGLIALTLFSLGLSDNYSAALHCFSVGAIGGMILSMMSRVSLGHTGRAMRAPSGMSLAFGLILAAALLRYLIPGWFPAIMNWGIGLAAAGWVVAYSIFAFYYVPMLVAARVDGHPG